MRQSKYWDDFERRIEETVHCLKNGIPPPVRRVAIFITNKCNFRCQYCNVNFNTKELSQSRMEEILQEYGKEPIYHITGGEPSTVKWLYPFLRENGDSYRFHLNTNAFIPPPAEHIRRLKVSLEGTSPEWDKLVQHPNAFNAVVKNIQEAIPHTIVSITYTLSKSNYKESINFAKFARDKFPGLYAIFFSVYKGNHPKFALSKEDVDLFFNDILPKLKESLDEESRNLIEETIDEKIRLMQGVRFPNNLKKTCFLSMSERVISPEGETSTCSHLYRDGIKQDGFAKHPKCMYGCNQRLVCFNNEVYKRL